MCALFRNATWPWLSPWPSSTSVGPKPKKPERSSKWQPEWAHSTCRFTCNGLWLMFVFLINGIILYSTVTCPLLIIIIVKETEVKSREICYSIQGIPFLRLASMHRVHILCHYSTSTTTLICVHFCTTIPTWVSTLKWLLLGRAEASPTLITHTRKSLYLHMYVCMYVCDHVVIRRPRVHCTIARVQYACR